MAGLEKFEDSGEWKNKLKKFLLMDRKPILKTTESIKDTQRYSMDISVDLQNILKEKNISRFGVTPKGKTNFEVSRDKENCIKNVDSPRNRVRFNVKQPDFMVYDTFVDVNDTKKQDSDESFEAIEKMCDKTASDPDSTLFQYLNSENKRDVIEATKKRLSGVEELSQRESEAEVAAINRILYDLREKTQMEIVDESPLKGVEMTQIEDIEAPSRFWDSTMLQTSPVKMVGLLRPSTILEEGQNESDTSSSQTSYRSAFNTRPSEISSACYETASETASFYNIKKSVDNEIDPLNTDSSSQVFEKETDLLSQNINDFKNMDGSRDLIDLEKTMAASNIDLPNEPAISKDQMKESIEDITESIIEILSDEEDPLSPFCSNQSIETTTPFNDKHTTLIKWESPLNVKKEVSTSFNYSPNNSNNISTDSPVSSRESLDFNDTLEEVEYMMKKGMELKMKTDNAANEVQIQMTNALTPNVLREKQNTFTISQSPAKGREQLNSCIKDFQVKHNEPSTKYKSALKSTPKAADRFALSMKPIPKFDLFKKPTSACKPGSSATVRHKDQFAHVISPIGIYVKKTAKAPLMTTTGSKATNIDSTAFLELEHESRLYQPKFSANSTTLDNNKTPNSLKKGVLPKKAYISSEFRQITDERSPVTIPGGKKIQKYLDAAVLPTVIQHEGKSKMLSKPQMTYENKSNTPKAQRVNKDYSLANLSLMSGDVSLYTIKDAKKL